MMAADTRGALIEEALSFLWKPGKVIELRIPGTNQGTQAGYFDDPDLLKLAALKLDGQAPGIYITLNPVNTVLLARGANRVRTYVKQGEGTKDKDVTRRSFFPVDFDAIRPAGISSTDEEHDAALLRAIECCSWLAERGWPQPLLADSGNGAHLVYAVDLPNDDAIKTVMQLCLKALGAQFNDDQVEVDRTTFNASRIWKLYGTHVCKGDSLPDRPHRLAGIAEAPVSLDLVPLDLLEQLAELAPQPNATKPGRVNVHTPDAPRGKGDYTTLDVVGWFDAHGHYGRHLESDKHAVLCPWSDEHSDIRPAGDSDTVIWEATGGKWAGFHCSHNHCLDRNLDDVMLLWGGADYFCSLEFQPQRSANPPTVTPADSNSVYSVYSEAGWEKPQDFASVEVPPFPSDALPDVANEYAKQEAEAKQVPLDLTGVCLIGAVSTAVSGTCRISLTEDWAEPLNGYFLPILLSGERKSPVVREIFSTIEEHEQALVEAIQPEILQSETDRDILEKRLNTAKTMAAKTDKAERESGEVDARALTTELAEYKTKVTPQLLADDATPEAVAGLLADQNGRISIVSTEGGIFDIMAGRYSDGGANLDVYLKGYSGDPIRVNRRSRGPEFVKDPHLSMVVTVQPSVIQDLASHSSFRSRGLLSRPLYSLPTSMVGFRNTNPKPVEPDVRYAWKNMLKACLNLPIPKDLPLPLIQLSAGAQTKFQKFRAEVELALQPGAELDGLADWGNKLPGHVARLAGWLHVMTHISTTDTPWNVPVTSEVMANAIDLGRYFKGHAKAAFALMGADPRLSGAKKVWAAIQHKGWKNFSIRDVHQQVRGNLKTVAAVKEVLGLLVDLGYIRDLPPEKRDGPGQPPSQRYEVNPLAPDQNTQNTQNHSPVDAAIPEIDAARESLRF